MGSAEAPLIRNVPITPCTNASCRCTCPMPAYGVPCSTDAAALYWFKAVILRGPQSRNHFAAFAAVHFFGLVQLAQAVIF